MKKIISNIKIIYIIVVILLSFIAYILWYPFRDFITAAADILAIPSLIISLDVLHTVQITPENFNNYSKVCSIENVTKSEIKERAKSAFDSKLGKLKQLKKICRGFYYNIEGEADIAGTVVNQINSRKNEFYDFFIDTKEYIFHDYFRNSNFSGISKSFSKETLDRILSQNEMLQISNKLVELNKIDFTEKNLAEHDKDVIKLLFIDNGLMDKYLNMCTSAYASMGNEE
ncbi:hypothetical protein [Solobacterium sp.]|uniref:hypothetical protein n=1 Tax=Solobacterium sp. TaxID=2060878 RepID=UPI001CAC25D8|nr:hypothetical protein [Solobacterium sp.]MBF1098724.1 hypothetical protein [Solobacterium sp.]